MPFDPNLPHDGALIDAVELRSQFNALKALNDALAAQVANLQFGATPIGGVVAWFKNKPGVPPLPPNFLECNGQTVSDPESPLDGVTLDDLNGAGHFLRGGNTSGQVGGSDTFAITTVDFTGSGTTVNVPTTDYSPGASPIPLHTSVVWVMRVK
jgi:hypothetical protein